MRADARRNHERLLDAARDVVIESGPHAPLEDVARRAGVGIATLYRRFPNRERLLEAVVLDALVKTADAARRASEEVDDPFDALARYLRDALELRVSAVIPTVLGVLDLEEGALRRARDESARLFGRLIENAQADGSLAKDVTFADVGMMLVRIARPLPGRMPPEVAHDVARRHLELFIRGLRAGVPDGGELSGPALSRADLHEMTGEER